MRPQQTSPNNTDIKLPQKSQVAEVLDRLPGKVIVRTISGKPKLDIVRIPIVSAPKPKAISIKPSIAAMGPEQMSRHVGKTYSAQRPAVTSTITRPSTTSTSSMASKSSTLESPLDENYKKHLSEVIRKVYGGADGEDTRPSTASNDSKQVFFSLFRLYLYKHAFILCIFFLFLPRILM